MSTPNDLEDIVLRSSDGVSFRVRRSVLSSTSPVFSDMFLVPQPSSDANTPIDVTEQSRTLRIMLDLCETYTSSTRIDLSDIASLLQAADKYDIKRVQRGALDLLSQDKFLMKQPLRVYAIASRFGAHDTAERAAQQLLRHPLLDEEYFSELEIVDGGTIYRVLQYHQRCKDAVVGVAVDHTWIRVGTYVFIECPGVEENDEDEDEDGGICTTVIRTGPSRKHKNGYNKSVTVHSWWTKFMAATKDALLEDMDPETIRDKSRVKEARSSASRCPHCRKFAKADFNKFLDAFENEVKSRVKEIKLDQPGRILSWE